MWLRSKNFPGKDEFNAGLLAVAEVLRKYSAGEITGKEKDCALVDIGARVYPDVQTDLFKGGDDVRT